MRKVITKKEAYEIAASHGPALGLLPGVRYERDDKRDGNMLTMSFVLDGPDFYVTREFTKNMRSNVVHNDDGMVTGGLFLAAFLVDHMPNHFGSWRQRFSDPRRILATRDPEDRWAAGAHAIATQASQVAQGTGALYPLIAQMSLDL